MPVTDEELVAELRQILKDVDMETTTGKRSSAALNGSKLKRCADASPLFREENSTGARNSFQRGAYKQEATYQRRGGHNSKTVRAVKKGPSWLEVLDNLHGDCRYATQCIWRIAHREGFVLNQDCTMDAVGNMHTSHILKVTSYEESARPLQSLWTAIL